MLNFCVGLVTGVYAGIMVVLCIMYKDKKTKK